MSKQEILDDMLAKYEAYVADWQDKEKYQLYCDAWHKWREVRGEG